MEGKTLHFLFLTLQLFQYLVNSKLQHIQFCAYTIYNLRCKTNTWPNITV